MTGSPKVLPRPAVPPLHYVALVIGELVNEELTLPPLPDPKWSEGEYPHGIRGEGWVGFAVAAFPKAAADRLCCAEIDVGALWPFDDDAVREYFDREASDAAERWNEYRIVCAARDIALEMGGSVMLVRGELP